MMAKTAILFLKIVGWLILLGSVVSALYYFKFSLDLAQFLPYSDSSRAVVVGATFAIIIGGIFLWALCIVVASITDSLLQTVDLLRYGTDVDDPPEYSPVRRVVRR